MYKAVIGKFSKILNSFSLSVCKSNAGLQNACHNSKQERP